MLKRVLIAGLAALCFCPRLPAARGNPKDGASPTPFIVVDQFGYLPDAKKVAVIRDPATGYDRQWHFAPGKAYQVVNVRREQLSLRGRLSPGTPALSIPHQATMPGSSTSRVLRHPVAI